MADTQDIIVRYQSEVDEAVKNIDKLAQAQDKITEAEKDQEKQAKETANAESIATKKRLENLRKEEAELKKLEKAKKQAFTAKDIGEFNNKINESKRRISLLSNEIETSKSGIQSFGAVRIWSEKYGEYDCNLVDIEPYAGQDKIQKANEILRNLFCGKEKPSETLKMITDNDHLNSVGTKSPYPFTVILKSGVKIGISEETNAFLIDEIQEGFKATDFGGNTFYRITQIAAIVPTENLT